jgi:hypothetical protein
VVKAVHAVEHAHRGVVEGRGLRVHDGVEMRGRHEVGRQHIRAEGLEEAHARPQLDTQARRGAEVLIVEGAADPVEVGEDAANHRLAIEDPPVHHDPLRAVHVHALKFRLDQQARKTHRVQHIGSRIIAATPREPLWRTAKP